MTRSLWRLFSSPTVWIGAAVIASYWIWAPLVPNDPQAEALRVGAIVFGLAVTVAYLPGVLKFLTERFPVTTQQLVMGIVVVSIGLSGNGIWLLTWRLSNFPEWMLHSDMNGWFLWIVLVGYVLHLTAARSIENEIPRTNWRRLLLTSGIALVLGVGTAWYSPDLSSVSDWLYRYVA